MIIMNVNKIKEYLLSTLNKIPTINQKGLPMRVVLLIGFLYIFNWLLYLYAWIYQWYVLKILDLQQLLALFKETTTNTNIAFILFLLGLLRDKNHNGIPDTIEKESDTNKL